MSRQFCIPWILLINPRANFTVISVKHAVSKLMYILVMCQQICHRWTFSQLIFIMQYACLLLRITNAFFNEIVLGRSIVLKLFGKKWSSATLKIWIIQPIGLLVTMQYVFQGVDLKHYIIVTTPIFI